MINLMGWILCAKGIYSFTHKIGTLFFVNNDYAENWMQKCWYFYTKIGVAISYNNMPNERERDFW